MMALTPSQVGIRRLFHQRIAYPACKDTGEVVAWLGAMQGQDYAGTKWAIGLRLPGSTDADIERAIADRIILRTWALRGTLHYVTPADIHWMVGLIAPRQIAGNALRYRQLALDEPTLARSSSVIERALDGGGQLTRTELFARLEADGISTAGQRGFYMLQRAGLERLLAQGEVRRGVTTFFALAPGTPLPKDEALAMLARRYFLSHGPATLADFAHWSGLPVSEARAGLETVKSHLVGEVIDGQAYWLSPEAARQTEGRWVLLPGFDEYVLGYKDRSAVLDAQYADAICPGGNGMFQPTLVSEGRIIGTWKRTIKKQAVDITVQPFTRPSAANIDRIAEEGARFGAFLGLKARIQYEITLKP